MKILGFHMKILGYQRKILGYPMNILGSHIKILGLYKNNGVSYKDIWVSDDSAGGVFNEMRSWWASDDDFFPD